jgi:hypothetical protein
MNNVLREERKMYYKVLNDNHSCVGSNMDWTEYLPDGDNPGKWTPKMRGELELCHKGYHLTDAEHLIDWISGNQLFEAEIDGEMLQGDNKVACRKMRLVRQVDSWNDKMMRLFAVWCAREALKLIDNPDPRSVNACDVAERYANGDATIEELAAARAAARAAAWDAAWDAAWYAAWYAAWDAARNAAWNAAWDAARNAAWAAQSKKLIEMLGLP